MRKGIESYLFFPAIAMFSGIFWIMAFWIMAGKIFFYNEFISALPVICGGIVSAFLAVIFRIDTSRCFKVRMIFLIISLFTFTIPAIRIYSGQGYELGYMIISSCIAFLAEIVCFIKLRLNKKEVAVIMLSDVLFGDLIMLVIVLFMAASNI